MSGFTPANDPDMAHVLEYFDHTYRELTNHLKYRHGVEPKTTGDREHWQHARLHNLDPEWVQELANKGRNHVR